MRDRKRGTKIHVWDMSRWQQTVQGIQKIVTLIQLTLTDLEIPELREGVDDDAEDDVETDSRDEDEEWSVIDD